jgi:hypothetical protein
MNNFLKIFISAIFSFTFIIFIAAIWVSLWDISPGTSAQCSMGVNAGPFFATTWSIYAQLTALFVFGKLIIFLLKLKKKRFF